MTVRQRLVEPLSLLAWPELQDLFRAKTGVPTWLAWAGPATGREMILESGLQPGELTDLREGW